MTSDKSFGQAYDERRDAARGRQKTARETNPVAYYGGEIGSAVAVPFTVGPRLAAGAARVLPEAVTGAARAAGFGQVAANAGAGLGARTVAGAREGGAYAAVHGFGHGEDGFFNRAKNALMGYVFGAPLGAVAPAAIDAGAAVVRGVTNPIRAYMNPQQVGAEKYVDALWRDYRPRGIGPEPENVAGQVRGVLDRHQNRLTSAQEAKPGVMSMDLGGENTRNLVRAAANQQSTGAQRLKNRLDTRQGNQWSRIEADLAETLQNPRDYAETVGGIISRRSAAAERDFADAFSVETPMTDRLRAVFARPTMQELQGLVARRLADEGQAVGLETRTRAIHRMKLELDNQIGMARRAQQMGERPQAGWDLRTLTALKRDLMSAIDNPAYRRALDNYAGESALAGAAEDGFERALTMHTEEIAQTIRGLATAGERDMWRLGAARAMAGKIRQGNVTRDRTENIFGSPDIQLRLRAIFPDRQSHREFQRRLVLEAKMSDSRKAVQGNSTTAKQLTQAEEAGQPGRAVGAGFNAAMGRFAPVMDYLTRQAARFTGMTPDVANAVIQSAMERGVFRDQRMWQRAIRAAERSPQLRAELVQYVLSAGGAAAGESNDQKGGQTRVTVGRPDHWPKTAPSGTP
jgi:hypothetical protein